MRPFALMTEVQHHNIWNNLEFSYFQFQFCFHFQVAWELSRGRLDWSNCKSRLFCTHHPVQKDPLAKLLSFPWVIILEVVQPSAPQLQPVYKIPNEDWAEFSCLFWVYLIIATSSTRFSILPGSYSYLKRHWTSVFFLNKDDMVECSRHFCVS